MNDSVEGKAEGATERSVRGLLAAFALEQEEAFARFCSCHGEDPGNLISWRIHDWAEAYVLDSSGLRQLPAEPLFDIGPAGILRPNLRWAERVAAFCEAVRNEVGRNPGVVWWPYRVGNSTGVALDVSGDAGEISLTLHESDYIDIPLDGTKLGNGDPRVIDAVDAVYLVSVLLDSLGLPSLGGGAAILGGPGTMAK